MYDLTLLQAQHRIADYHRMMDRVNGAGGKARYPAQRTNLRVAVAHLLLSLATRLAPPPVGRQSEAQPIHS
jgi:hypothetical protein